MKTKCTGCKEEFECDNRKYNWNTKNNIPIYCTKECYNKSKSESKRIECSCANCGKTISKTITEIKKSKTGNVYCSKSCAVSKNNKDFKKYENHPNYINGITTYRERKLEISENKCEDCGLEDIRVLEVHHLDKNRKNNKMENLVILCANCHKIRHSPILGVGLKV